MPSLAAIAALIGDPSRAAMLQALLPGEALTAGELARVANIGAPAASGALNALTEAGLLRLHAQGRHRYFALAGEEIASALETLMALPQASPRRAWPHGEAFREGRLCWHHLAGRLGVALHARLTGVALQARGAVLLQARGAVAPQARGAVAPQARKAQEAWLAPSVGGWACTPAGEARLTALGVDLEAARRAPRFACDCMDWSERRPHLAGGLGREVTALFLRRRWLTRLEPRATDTLQRRRLTTTPEGRRALAAHFGIEA
jgi:DNA-binding transcriptional ArsR family regulator